jgi:hypothetical protein
LTSCLECRLRLVEGRQRSAIALPSSIGFASTSRSPRQPAGKALSRGRGVGAAARRSGKVSQDIADRSEAALDMQITFHRMGVVMGTGRPSR